MSAPRLMSVPSLSALLSHEQRAVSAFAEQPYDLRVAWLVGLNANPHVSGTLLTVLRTLHDGIEAPDPEPVATAPGNHTAKPITCPDCGTEIAPDDSARMDVLAALDAHAHACFSRSLDIASTRARLLALLGIADR